MKKLSLIIASFAAVGLANVACAQSSAGAPGGQPSGPTTGGAPMGNTPMGGATNNNTGTTTDNPGATVGGPSAMGGGTSSTGTTHHMHHRMKSGSTNTGNQPGTATGGATQ